MTSKISAALVGAGAMGGALLRGWIANGVIDGDRSAIFDPALDDALEVFARAEGLAINPPTGLMVEVLVIAVKPQIAKDILPTFAPIARGALVVSVMAGRTVASIKRALPDSEIVRAMPNLPAAVGAGVTALYAPPDVPAEKRDKAEILMSAVGETLWVENEEAIDAATAVSGCGPAYFFLLAEALAESGRTIGLSKEIATKLARATLVGAGAFVGRDPQSLADLRRAVASPGGATEAALEILDGDRQALRRLMEAAAGAAVNRARELTE